MGYATCWGGVVLGWLPTNVYAACSGGVVGLSSGDVDSCGDVPQYKVMKYLVFGIISTSLLRSICTRSTVFYKCFLRTSTHTWQAKTGPVLKSSLCSCLFDFWREHGNFEIWRTK